MEKAAGWADRFILFELLALILAVGACPAASRNAQASSPRPSAGCGNAKPLAGARTIAIGGETVPYLVSLPANYNPKTAYPLGFAFHGRNRTHVHCQTSGDCAGVQDVMKDRAVLVYLKSISPGWEGPAAEQNLQSFSQVLATMKKEYCIDEGRVFVAGTSSGAAFTNLLGCRFGDQLQAVIPVAGRAATDACQGTPAALVIHGVSDHVEVGERARDAYAERNGCPTKPAKELAKLRERMLANRQEKREEYACVDYVGCRNSPVRWCEHSVGGYNGTTHGWPPQGGQSIWDFLARETLAPSKR